jgi:ATP-dependent helicase HrpB
MVQQRLPIDDLIPDLERIIRQAGATLLLQAPPGAGKTTRVPSTVQGVLGGVVWMLEPRRIAARHAAQRIADERGQRVGGQVGYSVRLESRISPATQIEVLTEGLFLKRLQADPSLEGVEAVIFDEFHERSCDGDLALALVRQARDVLRPDLRVIVMSATLSLEPLARQLPQAHVLQSQGRSFPVTITHQPPRPQERLDHQVIRALEQHWLDRRNPHETVLVFLPGLGEIHACQRSLACCTWSSDLEIVALHGNLSLADQAKAVAATENPAGRVVLATSIAESSLTIAGVALVIDSGFSRRNHFDPSRGLNALVTHPASQASAEQRSGRAGRLSPGRCVRLWSLADQQRRPAQDPAELLVADPLPLALQLARWGDPLGTELTWIDPPPVTSLQEARGSLASLGALQADGQLSPHGRAMAEMGLHPRLAHLLLCGRARSQMNLACELAVLLSERDPLKRQEAGVDLMRRLDWLRRQAAQHPMQRLKQQLLRLLRRLEIDPPQHPEPAPADDLAAALLVATAFPERIGLARPGRSNRYLLRNGSGARLADDDPLGFPDALAVAAADGAGAEAHIHLALPLPQSALKELADQEGEERLEAQWDGDSKRVRCERKLQLGALVLERRPWPDAPADQMQAALMEGLRQQGLSCLPWDHNCRQLQHRLSLAHHHRGEPWPNRHDNVLNDQLEVWLACHLQGCQSLADLQTMDLETALWGDLNWSWRLELDRLLPGRLTIPSGRSVCIDYSSGRPVLAVKLQELFGCQQGPTVLDGSLTVTLHLLTPAGRTAAITQDLGGFWRGSYREVRRELRGRYPKHPWPEDGMTAQPSTFPKRRKPQPRP